MTSDENYYKILSYLDERVKIDSDIDEESLKEFKATIRDNKYVSTYIRAFKEQMQGYDSIDDFIKMMDKHDVTKSFDDVVPYMIRDILNTPFDYSRMQNDPIKLLNEIISNALEREGKLCDFRDSVHPETKFGRCQNEEHNEMVDDDLGAFLTEDECKQFQDMAENDDGKDLSTDPYHVFYDKITPETELILYLGTDMDIHKFDDNNPIYTCKKCDAFFKESGDCEVSCDMG